MLYSWTAALLSLASLAGIHSTPLTSLHKQTHTINTDIERGQIQYFLQRPEGERYYYAYIPQSYTPDQPVSLHISYHGLGGECRQFAEATGFNEFAEQYNFIHVYPKASSGYLGPGWNAGSCCIGADVDDIAFTRDIIADVQSKYSVDTDHIFAAGFSNGAFMCETLACNAPDVFAGIASISGDMVIAGGIEQCDKTFATFNTSLSVLHVHGDSDEIVPYTGSTLLGFPDVLEDVTAWAKRNKCSAKSANTMHKVTFTNQLWEDDCTHGGRVELVTSLGGGHTWPRTADFNTSSYIIDFFNSLKPRHLLYPTDERGSHQLAVS